MAISMPGRTAAGAGGERALVAVDEIATAFGLAMTVKGGRAMPATVIARSASDVAISMPGRTGVGAGGERPPGLGANGRRGWGRTGVSCGQRDCHGLRPRNDS